MKQHALPLALCGLALVLSGLSFLRWSNGGGIDWFSAIVAVITVALAIMTIVRDGPEN